MSVVLRVRHERWPIAGRFAISRGAKTWADVVVTELVDGGYRGRGECVPYARYGETVASVVATLEATRTAIADAFDRHRLQRELPPGAARNALDCALWDLEAKRAGRRVHELLGRPAPHPIVTAYTISLDDPEAMARAAGAAQWRPLLKVKLGADGTAERLGAVRKAAPTTKLIVDANEAWTAANVVDNLATCAQFGVTLVEQPLPADQDELLVSIARPIPVCADESVRDRTSLPRLVGKYDAINVKLDKAGGLTEAVELVDEAARCGIAIMVGCMVATSLAIAPAIVLAQRAWIADLDGPVLLAADRTDGLAYDGSLVHPPTIGLWG